MREPPFWWRPAGLEAKLLAPVAAIYGAVAARRLARKGRRAGAPVVCIGNPTVGGAGKTPLALAVARMLAAAREQPVFLSRGYGGRLAGPLKVDPQRHRSAEVGDEPLLLARVAPTIVAHDRVRGAEAALAAGARVIVMDDGFQNPSLLKDVAVLVVDARRGIGLAMANALASAGAGESAASQVISRAALSRSDWDRSRRLRAAAWGPA
jgi:tetraacyldisaccharide 4'-kinase